MTETQRLEMELGRAYRAVRGFYACVARGIKPDEGLLAYHSPTIAAAIRFVNEGSLEGASYFEGKPVDVLHAILKSAR